MSKLNILYEDNHIIVVVKPYNVLSQGDATGDRSIMDDIKDYIKVKYHKPGNVYLGLVHRLDRPVGGIMVFARSSKAASRLSKAFNEHSIIKKYMAIVHGKVSEKEELVDYIEKDKNGFDCVFTLGGDGTQKSARDFSLKGINVIGIPKTRDNDVACTEITCGYNTAVSVATEALDRLHSTAESHHRIMTLEVMGRYAGWIALESAIAGGADAAIIPEIPYDIEKIVEKINRRKAEGKKFSIIVVSEGAKPKGGELTVKRTLHDGAGLDNIRLGGIGEKLSRDLEELTGMVSRNTVLGYVQRGGTPTAFDRVLSTKYGSKAMELAIEGKFNVLVTLQNGRLGYVTLEEVVGNNKEIGARSGGTESTNIKRVTMDDDLVRVARDLDICLGD